MPGALRFSLADARAILEYDHEVFDRFVRKVRRLPGRRAMQKRGIGHESLFDTLVHILNVHEVWLVYIVRGRNSDAALGALFDDAGRHPRTWQGFDEYADRVWAGVSETVRGWTVPDLGRRVRAFWMPGRYTVRDAVLQTTLEEAHHLGEIIGALWQEEVKSPDMTWLDVRRAPSRRSGTASRTGRRR